MIRTLRHVLAVLSAWLVAATLASAADIPIRSFDMTAPSPGGLRTEALLPSEVAEVETHLSAPGGP